MSIIPKYENENRNAATFLSLSLKFAEEYFDELYKLRVEYSVEDIQSSKKLNTLHRALWTSLIVEVRKLYAKTFTKYQNYSLKETSFFQKEPHKPVVDQVYGSQIIQKILTTSNTFTVHLGKKKMNILSVDEICNSDLRDQLEKLKTPINSFEKYSIEEAAKH